MELLFKVATVNGDTVKPEFNAFKKEVMKSTRKGGKHNG